MKKRLVIFISAAAFITAAVLVVIWFSTVRLSAEDGITLTNTETGKTVNLTGEDAKAVSDILSGHTGYWRFSLPSCIYDLKFSEPDGYTVYLSTCGFGYIDGRIGLFRISNTELDMLASYLANYGIID